MPANEARADRIAREHGRSLKRVLVAPDDDGYVIIDGVHRTRAAELTGSDVPAIVLQRPAFDALKHEYSGEQIHEWAHSEATRSY